MLGRDGFEFTETTSSVTLAWEHDEYQLESHPAFSYFAPHETMESQVEQAPAEFGPLILLG